MGCGTSHFQNPSKYDDRVIIKCLKRAEEELFMSSLEKYKDYASNKGYYDLITRLIRQIQQKTSEVNSTMEQSYRNSKKQSKKEAKQNSYRRQLTQEVEDSSKNIFSAAKKAVEIINIIYKEYNESKNKNQELRSEWLMAIQRIAEKREIIKRIDPEMSPQVKESSRSKLVEPSEELRIDQNLKRVMAVSQVSCEQISQIQKQGVIETEKNAISRKFEKQLQKQRERYEKQLESMRQKIIRNNIESNTSLKFLTMQSQKKRQQLQKIIDRQNQQIRTLLQKLEEKDQQIATIMTTASNSKETNNNSIEPPQNRQQLRKSSEAKGSFRSSQLQQKFVRSRVLSVHSKDGGYRGQIDQIFGPIIINGSKLIFEYDKVSRNNMNNYITNEKDLLFVAKLENGVIIGGFSKEGFKQTTQSMSTNYCFIFSLHPNNTYYKLQLKSQGLSMHSVKLDSNFLKFGSNQIRISCQKQQGFCTVGTSSCIFGNGKEKGVGLLEFVGQNNQNFKMKSYEIFRVGVHYPEELTGEVEGEYKFLSEIPMS